MNNQLVTEALPWAELQKIAEELGYIPLSRFIKPQYDELVGISKLFNISKNSVVRYIEFLDKLHQYITEDIGSVDLKGFGFKIQEGSVRIKDEMIGGKTYYTYKGLFFGIENSDFTLEFAITNFGLHLQHLEVSSDKRNKGFGSLLMDIVLDVADEMKVDVSCVPTDIIGYDTELGRIRKFYVGKGFKRMNNHIYKYYPK